MPRIPSDIPFVSFLQYAPQGISGLSRESKEVVLKIKTDGFHANKPIIPYAVERFEQNLKKLEGHRGSGSPQARS